MGDTISTPKTVNKLTAAVDAAFAMLAGMQLDLFTPLKDGPMTAEELAAVIGVGHARLRLLLYLLVVAGLILERDGQFSNTEEANQFLVKGKPSYIGNRHAALAMRWTQNLNTAESIRSGVPKAKLDFANSPPERLGTFLRNINARTVPSARALIQQADLSSIRTVLDVGCGGAGVAITITDAYPHVAATAVDLPPVARIAEKIVSEEGAAERVKVAAADIVNSTLSETFDAAILRAFLQVLSTDDALRAVQIVARAISPGGRIFVIGHILDDSRIAPLEAVGMNLAFINTFDAGESYTESEYREWLTNAGFVEIERSLLQDGSSLITGRKPDEQFAS